MAKIRFFYYSKARGAAQGVGAFPALSRAVRPTERYARGVKGGRFFMTNAEVLDKAIRYLRLRCGAAYRAKDDDLLLKIVPVLCKAVEMQQKLSGAEDAGCMEIVLRGEEALAADAT